MIAVAVGLLGVALAAPAWGADGAEPARVLLGMEAAYATVERYTARFARQEVVAGDRRPREEALVKFQRPDRMYLRWIEGPPKGRELLFVRGRHGDRALIHGPGILAGLFTVLLAPDSPRVLSESRHPITDVGLGRLIDLILGSMRRAQERGELVLRDAGLVEEGGRRGRRIEMRVPRGAGPGEDVRGAVITIDGASGLPVAAILSDEAGRPVAEYAYTDLRLNPPLSPLDFDPANPAYGFPRWRLSL
ncbi:MAG: DUF1571 domain-containing protein [Candidatus Rokubacteria bacterium]|nr:DUF1571 domain-containing protein [Candidatus Rokubacteria bacterium]